MKKQAIVSLFFLLLVSCLAFGQGQQIVQGNAASGATDAGNPVKVGGRYNSGGVTLTDGQRGDLQLDSAGRLIVNVGAGSSGNAAASATGSAVPASADYCGVNVGGTLRGCTAVNPSGSIYAQQIDIASAAGTTLDTNSGNKSAGTIRVVLATDQPALTNKLLVTPDANSAVNIGQINGVTPLMGAGNTGTGSLRVTVASDQAAITVSQFGNWQFIPKNNCGTTATDSAFIADVATGGTDLFTAATCVDTIIVSNTTSSNSTFTLQDKSGTPKVLINAAPIAANSAVPIHLGLMKFIGGVTVKCGNSSTCQAQGFGWQ